MVNPYLINTGPRAPPKPQIQLSQSQAMKKFEKIQAKNSTSLDRRSNSFTRKSNRNSYDSSKDDDEVDEDDEDSIFKNSKKFMKKNKHASPPVKTRQFIGNKQTDENEDEIEEEDDEEDEDIEISANENRNNSRMSYKNNSLKNRSGASSVSSMIATNEFQPSHRRSQSKVKFVADNINDYLSDNQESTIIEDIMSRNLVLDVEDLEPAMSTSNSKSPRKSSIRKFSKSPLSNVRDREKRSESAASIRSIIEEKENSSYSSLTPSIPSPSLLETNLILDINELEKNVAKKDNKSRIHKKSETGSETETTLKSASKLDSSSETSSSESNHKKERRKKKDKEKKRKDKEKKEKEKEKRKKEKEKKKIQKEKEKEKEKKDREKKKKDKYKQSKSYSTIKTEKYSQDETSIATDIATENQFNSDEEIRTYKTDTETSRPSSRTTTTATTVRSRTNTRRPTSRSSIIKESRSGYYDDFETDQDVTASRPDSARKKQLSFAGDTKSITKTRTTSILKDAEIQVNTNDLFKNSDLVRSLNIYNPSSLLISSLSHFDQLNLRDLNQITGYNMINHAFNDLFRANLNFIRNFLATQRNMYELQMQSFGSKK